MSGADTVISPSQCSCIVAMRLARKGPKEDPTRHVRAAFRRLAVPQRADLIARSIVELSKAGDVSLTDKGILVASAIMVERRMAARRRFGGT